MTQPPSLLITLFFVLSGRLSWGNKSNHQHFSSSSSCISSSCRDAPGLIFHQQSMKSRENATQQVHLWAGHVAASTTQAFPLASDTRTDASRLLNKLRNQVDAKLKWQSEARWWEHKCDFGRCFYRLYCRISRVWHKHDEALWRFLNWSLTVLQRFVMICGKTNCYNLKSHNYHCTHTLVQRLLSQV